MIHQHTTEYKRTNRRKPNLVAKQIIIDFAVEACKKLGGAVQIKDNYWIVDTDFYDVVRKSK